MVITNTNKLVNECNHIFVIGAKPHDSHYTSPCKGFITKSHKIELNVENKTHYPNLSHVIVNQNCRYFSFVPLFLKNSVIS